jgi:cystathionine beta-lyase family protein involved in aluminum resistance
MYEQFGISKELEELSIKVEKEIKDVFERIERICEVNSLKVLKAMQNNNLSTTHLNSSTGYGIDEPGRNKIEEIYAEVFKAEDAIVRSQLISSQTILSAPSAVHLLNTIISDIITSVTLSVLLVISNQRRQIIL